MRKIIFLLAVLIYLFQLTSHAQSYGLRFASHEAVQEKRTSLNLNPSEPFCFHNTLELSFDMKLSPHMEIYFGYIFRLIANDHHNIDLIYNEKSGSFDFIVGETLAGVIKVDSARLRNEWTRISVQLDAAKHTVALYLDNTRAGEYKIALPADGCTRIFFGKNEYEGFQTADTPPMSIREIRLRTSDQQEYHWPLSETTGNTTLDLIHGRKALVSNPIWIKQKHQSWELTGSYELNGAPSIAFDSTTETIYIVTADSLYRLPLRNARLSGVRLTAEGAPLPRGNQSLYIPFYNKLYNFYIDERTVRTYDTVANRWDQHFKTNSLTEFWQANKFFSTVDTSLYIVDGYGQMTYKNKVQRYHIPTGSWDTAVTTGGDFFMPRYLAALGTNATTDTAWIIGGYGSPTGNQVVNPRYNYELLGYSVKDHHFKSIYHFKEPDQQFCFANSLIIDPGTRDFYTLIYPNDVFHSSLQLIQGHLDSPVYQRVGDTIPYTFYDIGSFAELYYCPVSKKLVTITLFSNKNTGMSSVRVYTLEFPPNRPETGSMQTRSSEKYWLYLLGVLAVLCVPVVLIALLKKKGKKVEVMPPTLAPVLPAEEPEPIPATGSAIFLFGQFEVLNDKGEDLTRLFSPLLKEMFLLIVMHTLRSGKGISSKKMYSTLWPNKSEKDAQNNRSVNMVKLKAILDKMDNCIITKEGDNWLLQWDETTIRLDLARFFALTAPGQPTNESTARVILQMVQRGEFLAQTEYAWLDDIKSEISGKVLTCLLEAAFQLQSADAEFLLEIANGIFLFDPINEEALRIKCKSLGLLGRHSHVKAVFEKFRKEYQEIYGETFPKTFQEVMNQPPTND